MSHESWVISLYLNRILSPLQLASRQQAIYSSQSQSVSQSPNIRRPEIEQSWPSLIIPQPSAAQPQWQSQSQASTWSDKSSAAPEKSRTLPSGLTLLGWLGLGWQCATGVGVGVTSLKEWILIFDSSSTASKFSPVLGVWRQLLVTCKSHVFLQSPSLQMPWLVSRAHPLYANLVFLQ